MKSPSWDLSQAHPILPTWASCSPRTSRPSSGWGGRAQRALTRNLPTRSPEERPAGHWGECGPCTVTHGTSTSASVDVHVWGERCTGRSSAPRCPPHPTTTPPVVRRCTLRSPPLPSSGSAFSENHPGWEAPLPVILVRQMFVDKSQFTVLKVRTSRRLASRASSCP